MYVRVLPLSLCQAEWRPILALFVVLVSKLRSNSIFLKVTPLVQRDLGFRRKNDATTIVHPAVLAIKLLLGLMVMMLVEPRLLLATILVLVLVVRWQRAFS